MFSSNCMRLCFSDILNSTKPPSPNEIGSSELKQSGDRRLPPQRHIAVCQRSIQPPNEPHNDKEGSSGNPNEHGPPLLLRLHVDCTPCDFNGLLKFKARPFIDTLCTQPTKSSECTWPGRSSTGSADDKPPISNGCLLKFNVLE